MKNRIWEKEFVPHTAMLSGHGMTGYHSYYFRNGGYKIIVYKGWWSKKKK